MERADLPGVSIDGGEGVGRVTKPGLDRLGVPVVKCSNFIGEALDASTIQGFEAALLVGHIGKLIKSDFSN